MKKIFFLVVVVSTLSAWSKDIVDAIYINFEQTCVYGVNASLDVVSGLNQNTIDNYRTRGINTCNGATERLKKSKELEKELNPIEFACGYAIGAMFGKFGMENEVTDEKLKDPKSKMSMALNKCVKDSQKLK